MKNRTLKVISKLERDFIKEADWEDMRSYIELEDDEMYDITRESPEERHQYYVGGEHPSQFFSHEEFEPEDYDTKEEQKLYQVDPEDFDAIVGFEEGHPYEESEAGKSFDVKPTDEEVLEDDFDSPDLDTEARRIIEELKELDISEEDKNYLKSIKDELDPDQLQWLIDKGILEHDVPETDDEDEDEDEAYYDEEDWDEDEDI